MAAQDVETSVADPAPQISAQEGPLTVCIYVRGLLFPEEVVVKQGDALVPLRVTAGSNVFSPPAKLKSGAREPASGGQAVISLVLHVLT